MNEEERQYYLKKARLYRLFSRIRLIFVFVLVIALVLAISDPERISIKTVVFEIVLFVGVSVEYMSFKTKADIFEEIASAPNDCVLPRF